MKIWLSRYNNRKAIQKHNLIPVSITVGKPRWNLGYEIADEIFLFEPSDSLFHTDVLTIKDRDEMKTRLFERLKGREKDVSDILERISKEHGNRDIVLLCYEDVREIGEWCHRQVIGEWLELQGHKVTELEDLTKAPPVQYDLQLFAG